ncbi:MAG: M20 family peptidase [Acidimicrobiia bacterium]|nr:MAG: M20 family peptidase [Acidimicrobiia bacterium]
MSKKSVATVAGAVAAVGIAIGWKASRSDRRHNDDGDSTTREPLLMDDVDAERFVDALSEAITYRTVIQDDGTYDAGAFDALGSMLARRYPRVHEELERETFSGHGMLYTWVGSDPVLDPIVLMAHQDVVPVEDGTEQDWVAPPFGGSVVDGNVYGRGALDCKGPLVAVFEAIEYLLEHDATPQRSVLVVSGHDEEIGGESGASVIADELRKRDVTPWFVIDEGGSVTDGVLPAVDAPIALVGIAEKGFMNVRLTARGEGGHSSIPPRGTSIARLARAISELEANPVPARIVALVPMLSALSDHLPGVLGTLASKPTAAASLLSRVFARDERMDALQRTTMVPTIVSGGVKANVVPQSASVVFNIRIIPGDTSSTVVDHIRNVVGQDIEIDVLPGFVRSPSRFSSVDSDAWKTFAGVVGEVFPSAVIAPYVLTGATDSRFFEGTAGDVYRFSPFVLDIEGIGGLHGTNEFVRVEDAHRAVSFFVRLIAVAAKTGDSP